MQLQFLLHRWLYINSYLLAFITLLTQKTRKNTLFRPCIIVFSPKLQKRHAKSFPLLKKPRRSCANFVYIWTVLGFWMYSFFWISSTLLWLYYPAVQTCKWPLPYVLPDKLKSNAHYVNTVIFTTTFLLTNIWDRIIRKLEVCLF